MLCFRTVLSDCPRSSSFFPPEPPKISQAAMPLGTRRAEHKERQPKGGGGVEDISAKAATKLATMASQSTKLAELVQWAGKHAPKSKDLHKENMSIREGGSKHKFLVFKLMQLRLCTDPTAKRSRLFFRKPQLRGKSFAVIARPYLVHRRKVSILVWQRERPNTCNVF